MDVCVAFVNDQALWALLTLFSFVLESFFFIARFVSVGDEELEHEATSLKIAHEAKSEIGQKSFLDSPKNQAAERVNFSGRVIGALDRAKMHRR